MIQEHPRAAEAHDGADFLPHVGTVAVHRAFVALGLGVAELAMVQTRQGILQQLPALSAQALPAVVLMAPQFDHVADCSFLPIDTIHCHKLLLILFPSTKAR